MFNKYPYTDFHELNLDWILGEINALKNPPKFEIEILWDGNGDPYTSVTPNQYNKAIEDHKKPVIVFKGDDDRIYKVWTNTMDINGLKVPDISYHLDPYANQFISISFTWTDLDQPFIVNFSS